jgi:hypothetical protein
VIVKPGVSGIHMVAVLMDCEKWENTDKCSAEYKKWHESKGYVEWKESHESGKADCSRVTSWIMLGMSRKEWELICGN